MATAEVILLVEGDPRERGDIQHALQLRGYAVLNASHPSEAILVALRYGKPIQLLLADTAYVGRRVDHLVGHISVTSPDAAVLLMCGDAWQPKGFHCVRKPFTMSQLLRRVRAALKAGPHANEH